jgi:hypothetical protein
LHELPSGIPAALFGIVLGLAGLGNVWRAAHQAWQTPAFVGEALMALAAVLWALLLLVYILKWIFAREDAFDEGRASQRRQSVEDRARRLPRLGQGNPPVRRRPRSSA